MVADPVLIDPRATCPLGESGGEFERSAEDAGLSFTADCMPGIRRIAEKGGVFVYRHDDLRVLSHTELARIEALKIPPAWEDVWICDDDRGHLQATGRDARERKQYRYHDEWRVVRDQGKYERLVEFGTALAKIRARVDKDMRRPAPDRDRVLALLVSVLDNVLIRVGNSQYARENKSFGLTTMRNEHVRVGSAKVRMRFRGKAGKEFEASIDNPRIARAIRRVRELPGQELFQYVDEQGEVRVVGSGDVNEYLQETAGISISSKDFRTWGGNLALVEALHATAGKPPVESAVVAAVKDAAALLGNTPAVCRRSYIHPGLVELYLSGGFDAAWERARETERRRARLDESERVLLGMLRGLGR